MHPRYILYVRKSQDRKDRQMLSIPSQLRKLRAVAAKHHLTVVEKVEEEQSAYRPGREGFERVVALIEREEADALLVWNLSRIARNSLDGGRVIHLMDEGKLREIRTAERVIQNTADDKFILTIEFGMAKKSSDDTSAYIIRDFEAKALKGQITYRAPLGYLNIDEHGRIAKQQFDPQKQAALMRLGRPLKRMEIDPVDGPLVRQLFALAATGEYSLDRLTQRARALGLRGKRSRGEVAKATVQSILKSPLYYGGLRYKGELYEGDFPPLVPKALWDAAQAALGSRSKPWKTRRRFAFTRLIRCGACGDFITASVNKGYRYYHCTKRVKQGRRCTQPYFREEELEGKIVEFIRDVTVPPEYVAWARRNLRSEYGKVAGQREAVRKRVEREYRRAQSRLKSLVELKISPENASGGLLSNEEFATHKSALLDEITTLKGKLHELGEPEFNFLAECEKYLQAASTLHQRYLDRDDDGKRVIFQKSGFNPILEDRQLLVQAKKPLFRASENTNSEQWQDQLVTAWEAVAEGKHPWQWIAEA